MVDVMLAVGLPSFSKIWFELEQPVESIANVRLTWQHCPALPGSNLRGCVPACVVLCACNPLPHFSVLTSTLNIRLNQLTAARYPHPVTTQPIKSLIKTLTGIFHAFVSVQGVFMS